MDNATRKKFASIKGNVLVTTSEFNISGEGVSVLGTKSLLITDYPAAYFHDSGGLMVQENRQSLEESFRKCAAIRFARLPEAEHQVEIRIFLKFAKSQVVEALIKPRNQQRAATLSQLLLDFGRATARTRDAELFMPVTLPCAWLTGTDTLEIDQKASDGVYLYAKDNSIHAHLCKGAESEATAVWSYETVSLYAENKADMRIEGEASWRGSSLNKAITGVRIEFPERASRDEFLAAAIALVTGKAKSGEEASRQAQKNVQRLNINKAEAKSAGIFRSLVYVEGPRFGGTLRLEVTLLDKRMECRLNGDTVLQVEYDNPALRVSATPERFIMYERDLGPISFRLVGGVEKSWMAALLGKKELVAAAKRAVQSGPFPVLILQGKSVSVPSSKGARAAVVKVEAGTLSILSTDLDCRIGIDEVKELKPDFGRELCLEVGVHQPGKPLRIGASLPLLEELQTAIHAESLARVPVDRLPAYLKAATCLEEEYFLDVIFGPCLHLHAALLSEDWQSKGIANLEAEIDIAGLEGDAAQDEARRLAELFVSGLETLRGHFDRVAQLLPAFVRHSDEQLLGATPDWLKQQESELRRTLSGTLARASMEVATLASQAGRISDIDPNRVKEDFSTTALAIGAGVVFNPFFLLGAAQQALQQRNSSQQRRADLSRQALDILRQLLGRWNSFVHELIPMLSYSLSEGLYPLRVVAAAKLGYALSNQALGDEAQQAGFRRVALRLARLDVRRRYPAAATLAQAAGRSSGRAPLTRGELVDHLRSDRDKLAADYFPMF